MSVADEPSPDIHAKAQEFLENLKVGNWHRAQDIFDGGDEGVKKECAKCLISLEDSELVELATFDDYTKGLIFGVALAFADIIFINKLFARFNKS